MHLFYLLSINRSYPGLSINGFNDALGVGLGYRSTKEGHCDAVTFVKFWAKRTAHKDRLQ